MHHATTDGYHVSCFIDYIQKCALILRYGYTKNLYNIKRTVA
ncbi:hypothetical protein [Clostridioides difficile]|nr:hypothetical protein [Clostridioides difficile]